MGNRIIAFIGIACASVASAKSPGKTEDFPELVARVSTAVVNIQATTLVKSASLKGYIQSLSGAADLETSQSSLGSGFIVAARGPSAGGSKLQNVLILTNDHVIASADEIEIMLAGSRERYLASVVAKDSQLDIAVLKATVPASIQPLRLGNSAKLRVGESVFAIGNPFGLGHTVTSGILSAKDRSLGISRADRYLQTDAAINFGNSGGPLFNGAGEVIGINTLVRVDAQGIGFAIPSDTVKEALPELESSGRIEHGWMGLVASNESTALRRHYKIQGAPNEGVVVTHLVKGAPAHKVSLQEGDLITAVSANGQTWETTTVWGLRDALDRLRAGTPVELQLRRGEKRFLGKMKLEQVPNEERLPEGHDYY